MIQERTERAQSCPPNSLKESFKPQQRITRVNSEPEISRLPKYKDLEYKKAKKKFKQLQSVFDTKESLERKIYTILNNSMRGSGKNSFESVSALIREIGFNYQKIATEEETLLKNKKIISQVIGGNGFKFLPSQKLSISIFLENENKKEKPFRLRNVIRLLCINSIIVSNLCYLKTKQMKKNKEEAYRRKKTILMQNLSL